MTKMDKEYIEKEYEQAIKEYNAALTEDDLDTARRTMKRLEAIAMQDYGFDYADELAMKIEKPRRSQLRGFLRATMSTFVFLAYWHYSICLSAFQVCPTSTTYKPYALQVLSLGCSPLLFPEGCFLSILRQSSPCLVSLVELCPCPHSLFQG